MRVHAAKKFENGSNADRSLELLRIPTSQLEITKEKLGSGAFAYVYKGVLSHGAVGTCEDTTALRERARVVAVKVPRTNMTQCQR